MSPLELLPVELLYEVQLAAFEPNLPLASRRLHAVFSSAPTSYRAQYILSCAGASSSSDILSLALRFPICTEPVLDIILRDWPATTPHRRSELPRRLFRTLAPRKSAEAPFSTADAPFPFVHALFTKLPQAPDADSHAGYALARAVHAEFMPLIRLLLARGASPAHKGGLAVLIAIRKKNLGLVRMLVEREEMDEDGAPAPVVGAKRRRLEDRVEVTREMLKTAVKAKARDIADWFMHDKGCLPDMQTLNMLMR
ncbi:hypothetical protein MKEN_00363900 [Mycena kentingensis (nom. inval.)]|nr:hypothetical protein MKEN_00363900 [Mycena kentingensis (nom. inval.)]